MNPRQTRRSWVLSVTGRTLGATGFALCVAVDAADIVFLTHVGGVAHEVAMFFMACGDVLLGVGCVILAIRGVVFVVRVAVRVARASSTTRGISSWAAAAAGELAELAAHLLPAEDRARYAEEYRAELRDLDQAGAPSHDQLAFALRLIGKAWPLRTALREPRRRAEL